MLNRNQLRSAAFNNPPRKRLKFSYNEVEFELLAPTVCERKDIFMRTNKDTPSIIDLNVWTAIMCTVEPGTNNKVFEESDFQTFEQMSMEGFLDAVTPLIKPLLNITEDPKG